MTFFDLFAGAGGFSLGFEMAGAESLLMLEKDEWAFNTYKANRKDKSLYLHSNIKDFKLNQIEKQISKSPDVIIGGPPCQGFSNAAGTRNLFDERNELFLEFYNWVEHFKPKFFVIENVLGLASKKDKSGTLYKELIIEKFKKINYKISFWTLNAMEYGVPQQRIRVFFIGTYLYDEEIPKPDITHSFVQAGLKKPITVGEAISDLPILDAGGGNEVLDYDNSASNEFQKWARKESSKVYNHAAMHHSERLVNRFRMIQQGHKLDDLPEELKVRKRGEIDSLSFVKFGLNYRFLQQDRISYTIPASFYSSFIHPFQSRNITAREAARLQSFPDWYVFSGKRTLMSNSLLKKKGIIPNLSQYNQIGNAVPPLLAKAIAEKIKTLLT